MSDTIEHPAKFSEPILELLRQIADVLPGPILDPFAGTGRIHNIGRDDTTGIEIEAEWAATHERTYLGDATKLPYPNDSFGSIVTSPAYGNRMADQ
jgi:tRNA G10  N-methylase Trm11